MARCDQGPENADYHNQLDQWLAGGNLGHCRDLADGVWEMKIDFGPALSNYFARAGKAFYRIITGGDKGTQKADIKEAKRRWKSTRKE